jgi:hypothetical protein
MRLPNVTLPAAFVLLTAGAARADSFLELEGGLSIPAGDDNWSNLAETSPNLDAKVGAVGTSGLGGMIQVDWTPINLNNDGASFGGAGGVDIAAHRFRFLADLGFQHRVMPKLILSARVGVGLDLVHASASGTFLGTTISSSDTNAGFGFEFGGGLWYEIGDIHVGGELALPIATHSKHGDNSDGNYTFDYTSYDFNLLFGVRILSR